MIDKATNQVPSANIILTNVCSNKCKYCFASLADSTSIKASYMSMDSFRFVLEFLERSKVKSVRLLGGEPLVHPDFELIIDEIMKNKYFENITVFTGGIFNPKRIKYLNISMIRVVVNTNHPKDYDLKSYDRFISNLESMADKGIKFALGFNIYEKDFDWSLIIQLGTNLGVDTLRLCVASPSIARNTQFLNLEEQRRIGHSLYSLINECSSKSIDVTFDCVVPPCIFTDAEWGSIVRMFPGIQTVAVCSPCLDIDPNLRVSRCFAVGESPVNLMDFETTMELNEFFLQQIDKFKWHATRKECEGCNHRLARICQGGCIAFSWSQITSLQQMLEKNRKFFDIAYAYLKTKEYEAAVAKFEEGLESYDIDTNIICDYIYALLKCNRINKAEQA